MTRAAMRAHPDAPDASLSGYVVEDETGRVIAGPVSDHLLARRLFRAAREAYRVRLQPEGIVYGYAQFETEGTGDGACECGGSDRDAFEVALGYDDSLEE